MNRRGYFWLSVAIFFGRGYFFSRAKTVQEVSKERGYFSARGYCVAISNVAIFRGNFRCYSLLFLVFAWLFLRGYF